MLNVAYQYKKAINKITDMRDMKLRQYEIEGHEWKLVWQLRDLLKVTHALLYLFFFSTSFIKRY
jgi:hypothetical protein